MKGMFRDGPSMDEAQKRLDNARRGAMSAVDDAITRITEAEDDNKARAIAEALGHRVLLAVADQLHIKAEGHGTAWVRNAVVKEARA